MKRSIIGMALAIWLAGCSGESSGTFGDGDDGSGTYAVERDGEGVTARMETDDGTAVMRSGADVPVDLPHGFTIYPGATVSTNTVFAEAGSKGALVTMESDAAPEDMIAFYRRQAESAGVDITLDMTTDTMRMIGGKARDGSPFSFTATAEGERTTGQLMAGEAF